MNRDINLIQPEQEKGKISELSAKIKTVSIVVFIFYALVAGAIFSYLAYLSSSNSATLKNIDSQKQEINRYRKIESLQVMSKQRLSELAKFLGSKSIHFQDALTVINQSKGEGIFLRETQMSSSGDIEISGVANSATLMATFLDNLKKDNSIFSVVKVNQMSRSTDGLYTFVLALKL